MDEQEGLRIPQAPLLISIREAARELGVSVDTAYLMVANGTMPGTVKVGSVTRVVRARLAAWTEEIGRAEEPVDLRPKGSR